MNKIQLHGNEAPLRELVAYAQSNRSLLQKSKGELAKSEQRVVTFDPARDELVVRTLPERRFKTSWEDPMNRDKRIVLVLTENQLNFVQQRIEDGAAQIELKDPKNGRRLSFKPYMFKGFREGGWQEERIDVPLTDAEKEQRKKDREKSRQTMAMQFVKMQGYEGIISWEEIEKNITSVGSIIFVVKAVVQKYKNNGIMGTNED